MPAAAVYFAYGSNLHPGRLARRAPSCRLLGVAAAEGLRLAFSKRGRDGSGKCTLCTSPRASVWMAAYRLRAEESASLDAVEIGYRRLPLKLHVGGQCLTGFTYVARSGWLLPSLLPFDWYRTLVTAGADYHGFPVAYLAGLRQTPVCVDPDPVRARRQQALARTLLAETAPAVR